MKVGVLCSRIRLEEKLLLQALRDLGATAERVDVGSIVLSPMGGLPGYDTVLVRCLSHSRALYASKLLSETGLRVVNRHEVIGACGDRVLASRALAAHGVPTPLIRFAFSQQAALEAVEEMGYPVVLKPLDSSGGQLSAKVNDRDGAETLLEHKKVLGGDRHSIFCIQEHVAEVERGIRAFVVGDQVVAATSHSLEGWQGNTGGADQAQVHPIGPELEAIALQAAAAVGGGVLAVDLLEGSDGRLLVVGVDHTLEFRSSVEPSPAEIARRIAQYVLDA